MKILDQNQRLTAKIQISKRVWSACQIALGFPALWRWSKSKVCRTVADGKYLILGTEGSEFVVSDGKGVYKTGEQIITSKVSTEVGEAAKIEIKNISFNDEDAIASLEELQQTYPGAEIYLNGELTVDFPEDVKVPTEPNQMVTAVLSGNSLKLNYCELAEIEGSCDEVQPQKNCDFLYQFLARMIRNTNHNIAENVSF